MTHDSFLVRFLKKWDEKILRRTIHHPWLVIGGASLLFLIAISTLPFVGTSFLPEFNEGTLPINIQAQPGTSLTESNRVGQIAEKLILQVPEVISTGRRTGRAELDEHAEGVHYTEIDVDLKKEGARGREEILNDIREKMAEIPGVSVNVGQPISHRIDHLQSGVTAQIAVKLFGDDLSALPTKPETISTRSKTLRLTRREARRFRFRQLRQSNSFPVRIRFCAKTPNSALQVMINIPLALIGAIAALLLTGGVFSIATLVGFISLVGVLGGILTSTLLDQIVTPAVFFKFGKHAAEKIIVKRDAKKTGHESEWGEPEIVAEEERERDVPPFSPDVSKPVLGD